MTNKRPGLYISSDEFTISCTYPKQYTATVKGHGTTYHTTLKSAVDWIEEVLTLSSGEITTLNQYIEAQQLAHERVTKALDGVKE